MDAALGPNSYGKADIHLVTVDRDTPVHTVTDLVVDVRLRGDFDAAHTQGDNRAVVPTDTMRGTVFAFARDGVGAPESFGLRLAHHFTSTVPAVAAADVDIRATTWRPVADHASGFVADRTGVRTAHVHVDRGDDDPDGAGSVRVRAGRRDVDLLKTADSGFADFHVDDYTTLPETDDRLLATRMVADWGYADVDLDWDAAAAQVEAALLDAFAAHRSRSLQHTLYAMGAAVLAARSDVTDVHLLLPNRHHLLVDLSAYGRDNPNRVFVSTSEPAGVIEATVVRRDSDPPD